MSNKQRNAVLEISNEALRVHRELDQSLAALREPLSKTPSLFIHVGNVHTHVKNQLTSLVTKLQNLGME